MRKRFRVYLNPGVGIDDSYLKEFLDDNGWAVEPGSETETERTGQYSFVVTTNRRLFKGTRRLAGYHSIRSVLPL